MHALLHSVAEPAAAPTGPASVLDAMQRWLAASRSRLAEHALQRRDPDRAHTRIRASFSAAVADIEGPRSAELQRRIRAALALRDLWHLRADIFALVSHAHDQACAQARLATLNRHFPTRSPGSGFGALDPRPPL